MKARLAGLTIILLLAALFASAQEQRGFQRCEAASGRETDA